MKSKNSSKIKFALAIPLFVVALFFFANPVDLVKASTNTKNGTLLTDFQDTIQVVSTDEVPQEEIFFEAEVMPKFQGQNSDQFRYFIQGNLKYPEEAQKDSIQGRVFIQFDIDKEGKLVNAKVVRGVHPSLDNEALRVTSLSPIWEPAMDKGRKVRVRFTFPIVFKLH